MKAPVILYVLLAFLDQGSSLQCEVCDGFTQDCSGYTETCDPGQDTCGIIKGEEIYDGLKMLFNWKSCVTSNVCNYRNSGIYSGKVFRLRRSIACCTGEACRTTSVQLPPLNTTLNGLQCPACFVSGSHECGNEIVYCTGSETYCFDFEGSLSKGGVSVKAAVKGCTSQSECNMSHDEKQELLRISVVFNRFECKLATPAASKASGWTLPPTLFLPIMAGLFLVKTMS
ncbi:phospholipase A2 inhibitor gamma subunit B-like [Alligator mississippiensis]|uniref:phospholipase A2 inhibitor gamma subunit B-like n=1 Tax=Alligator mississippiensis TaxID=8496 RepID=UPI002877FF89|nr:phospholipase A2 inhibitor gamma subunit B-like [Alligator mississippiensis]